MCVILFSVNSSNNWRLTSKLVNIPDIRKKKKKNLIVGWRTKVQRVLTCEGTSFFGARNVSGMLPDAFCHDALTNNHFIRYSLVLSPFSPPSLLGNYLPFFTHACWTFWPSNSSVIITKRAVQFVEHGSSSFNKFFSALGPVLLARGIGLVLLRVYLVLWIWLSPCSLSCQTRFPALQDSSTSGCHVFPPVPHKPAQAAGTVKTISQLLRVFFLLS